MSTYDLTKTTPAKIATGDILNCPYSGAAKSVNLPPGRYKLEVWGAQGGYRSSTTYGGKGGYSVCTLDLDTAMLLYLYVGGSGNTGGTSGGFNGGGLRATYPGGGGGSGYVYTSATAASYPTGCLLTSKHYLTDAATTAGNASFTGPTGTAETGHSGDGYARITALEVYKQTPDAPANFRQTAKDYFSLSLAWDAAEGATSYKLYRDGALLATLTGTTYTDTDVSPNSSYVYTVSGVNAEGEGDPAQLTASTSEGYVVQIIEISGAVLTPNPADINSKVSLAVSVSETIKVLEPYYYHSGDLYAGEV